MLLGVLLLEWGDQYEKMITTSTLYATWEMRFMVHENVEGDQV